jgi:hypothetical protein
VGLQVKLALDGFKTRRPASSQRFRVVKSTRPAPIARSVCVARKLWFVRLAVGYGAGGGLMLMAGKMMVSLSLTPICNLKLLPPFISGRLSKLPVSPVLHTLASASTDPSVRVPCAVVVSSLHPARAGLGTRLFELDWLRALAGRPDKRGHGRES